MGDYRELKVTTYDKIIWTTEGQLEENEREIISVGRSMGVEGDREGSRGIKRGGGKSREGYRYTIGGFLGNGGIT